MKKLSLLLDHGRLCGDPIVLRFPTLSHVFSHYRPPTCVPPSAALLCNTHSRSFPNANNNKNRNQNVRFFVGRGVFVSSSHPAKQLRGRHLCQVPTSTLSTDEEISPSAYFSVRIQCSREFADMLSEALLCFGASSSSIEDSYDSASLDKVFITSIFTEGEVVNECISLASSSIGMEVPSFEVKKCEQCDWITSFQETFHPVKITDSFWIIPEWRNPPDVHATNVILNPGLAFGTGEHPTTKLCLLLLSEMVAGGESVLDYGTGSGILGISAIKLGAAHSLGVDVDPQAIQSACHNAALNNIGPDKMQLYLATCKVPSHSTACNHERDTKQNLYIVDLIPSTAKYDIIVANILLNPLLELAENITCYAKPGGTVGISGFLLEQLPQIEECYSSFLENMSVSEMDGWACLRGTKRL